MKLVLFQVNIIRLNNSICRSICLGYARKLTKKKSNFQKLALAIEEGGFKVVKN